MTMTRHYIPVAEIARPHGVRGELRLSVYNLESGLLSTRPPVKLRLPDGTERDATFSSVRAANKGLLAKLAGVDGRDAAEALRGAVVCVPRDAFPPPDDDEFYACDLEGARAVMASGEAIGRVSGVTSYPTCDVLVVVREDGAKLEVPLTDAYVASVDPAAGEVRLVTIDGLS
jgi:16S rRNA processing protein RimM